MVEINLKRIRYTQTYFTFRNTRIVSEGMNWIHMAQNSVHRRTCEHCNGLFVSINDINLLTNLSDCELLKNTAPWYYFLLGFTYSICRIHYDTIVLDILHFLASYRYWHCFSSWTFSHLQLIHCNYTDKYSFYFFYRLTWLWRRLNMASFEY